VIVVDTYAATPVASGTGEPLVVELPYDLRKKSRLRAESRCGKALGIFLPRGNVMADGDLLLARDGQLVRVEAAREPVSVVRSENSLLLTRAAYHLGNRHVPLQIEAGSLTYQHDHVLDRMVEGLGLAVAFSEEKFQPESGAYHSHSHSDSPDSHHAQSQSHNHSHSHSHSHHHDHGQSSDHEHYHD